MTGQLQYMTPGVSVGAPPHASLTTPMITCPSPAKKMSNVARVVRVKVSSALPKPCAKPSTTGRSGISMPARLASRFSRRHRASAAILRPSATSASTMDASSSSTTVTCRITRYMVPTRLAFKAPGRPIDWYRLVPATFSLVCVSPAEVPTAQSMRSST